MGGNRAQLNKPHKSRFSSKATRDQHKTSLKDKSKNSKNVVKEARASRIQRSKMIREQKKTAVLQEKRALSGSKSSPRVIVLIGLSSAVDLNPLAEELLSLLSPGALSSTVASPEYKLRATVLKAPYGDLQSSLEMAKVADLIAFVASASYYVEESTSLYIDSFGSECLSVLRSLGLPSTVVLIRDLPTDMKKKNDLKKMCISSITSEFPEDCKFHPADTKDELHKFMWLFKEQRLTVPHWRSHRPYLMSQKVDAITENCTPGKCTLLLTGYLRARSLSVNQLVHVAGAGDFQLCKIEVLKDPVPLNPRKEQDGMDYHEVEVVHTLSPSKPEPLVVENDPDPLSGEQTWPTKEDRAEAVRNQKEKHLRKNTLGHGTSDYQEAWKTGETDDEDSDVDNESDGMMLDGGGYPNEEDLSNPGLCDDQASILSSISNRSRTEL